MSLQRTILTLVATAGFTAGFVCAQDSKQQQAAEEKQDDAAAAEIVTSAD